MNFSWKSFFEGAGVMSITIVLVFLLSFSVYHIFGKEIATILNYIMISSSIIVSIIVLFLIFTEDNTKKRGNNNG